MLLKMDSFLTGISFFYHTHSLAATKELRPYEYYLKKSASFNDPRGIDNLMQELGLSGTEIYSNMSSMKGKFPQQEYAGELRNSQASKWAFRYVRQNHAFIYASQT